MRPVTLAITSLAAIAFSAGLAVAQMQPIPNPPESHHMMHHGHHGHHAHHARHHHHKHK